jgi:hypothetical protein
MRKGITNCERKLEPNKFVKNTNKLPMRHIQSL